MAGLFSSCLGFCCTHLSRCASMRFFVSGLLLLSLLSSFLPTPLHSSLMIKSKLVLHFPPSHLPSLLYRSMATRR
ncbi:uncharacterized protein BKA78DRAFT_315344 [Phyllosticta capitalensis]|uniref:uncharacterized protein n=1 Tax=Phyllosticta capitalensis TaxID=121624 RepID=UPI00312DB672